MDNVQLSEQIITINENNSSQAMKLKKLEKFYLKMKNKKYRNCGSQTEPSCAQNQANSNIMQDKENNRQRQNCQSALIKQHKNTLGINADLLLGNDPFNENFSKIDIGQSFSEERKSLRMKKFMNSKTQLKIKQMQEVH